MARINIASVKSSRCVQPYRTLVYGPEKVGKTSLLANCPKVVAIDIEGRMGHVDVPTYPQVTSWQEALDALESLRVEKHDFENVLIDSVSALEKHLKVAVMEKSGWDAIEADEFQRWLKAAVNSFWPEFFTACERLQRERGMGVLMTAHQAVKTMKNPGGEPYDRFRPGLGGDLGPTIFLHWCHDVMRADYEDIIRSEKKGGRDRIRMTTTGQRVLYTQHTPGRDAGNSCGLPPVIPMDWDEYARLRAEGLGDLPSVKARIESLLKQVEDESVRVAAKKHYAEHSSNVGVCRAIAARLREIVDGQSAEEPEAAQTSEVAAK